MSHFDYLLFLAPAYALAFTVAVLTPSDEPPDWSEFFKSKRMQFFTSYGIFWLTLISWGMAHNMTQKFSFLPIYLRAAAKQLAGK